MEKRETELKKNMATVEKDKQKIEETIEELDRYKRDALQKTWKKVNEYVFSSEQKLPTSLPFRLLTYFSSAGIQRLRGNLR